MRTAQWAWARASQMAGWAGVAALGVLMGWGAAAWPSAPWASPLRSAEALARQTQTQQRQWQRWQREEQQAQARWQALGLGEPPDPIAPPQSPDPGLPLREAIEQGLAFNGLSAIAVERVREPGPVQWQVQAQTPLATVLALVVQVDEASPQGQLVAWAVHHDPAHGDAPLSWRLRWRETPSPEQGAKANLAFVPAANRRANEGQSLRSVFAVGDWWRRNFAEAPVAQGASATQWRRDRQRTQGHNAPWTEWQPRGWVGAGPGRRALAQRGTDSARLALGDPLGQDHTVLADVRHDGCLVRSWTLSPQGQWQHQHHVWKGSSPP